MAINLYSGTPGGGKSLDATYEVLDWLKKGKTVICNFPIKMNYFKNKKKVGKFVYLTNDQITVDYLIKFANENHRPGTKAQTLVVIDEASLIFNCRSWDSKDRMQWLGFLANHRHFNFDFILISQNDRMLDRQIRGLIESDFKHRSLKNYKAIGIMLSVLFGGLFVSVEYFYPVKMYIGKRIFRFNKRKAEAYDTMAMFGVSKEEKTAPVVAPVATAPVVVDSVPAPIPAGVSSIYVFYVISSFFHRLIRALRLVPHGGLSK